MIDAFSVSASPQHLTLPLPLHRMIVPMSMGSYDGMPAASDPRRKPLEHLVTAFLQAVMRVQNKQQQVLMAQSHCAAVQLVIITVLQHVWCGPAMGPPLGSGLV